MAHHKSAFSFGDAVTMVPSASIAVSDSTLSQFMPKVTDVKP